MVESDTKEEPKSLKLTAEDLLVLVDVLQGRLRFKDRSDGQSVWITTQRSTEKVLIKLQNILRSIELDLVEDKEQCPVSPDVDNSSQSR